MKKQVVYIVRYSRQDVSRAGYIVSVLVRNLAYLRSRSRGMSNSTDSVIDKITSSCDDGIIKRCLTLC
jgi:hypothetical protein